MIAVAQQQVAQSEKKNKVSGFVISLVIHVVVLASLLLLTIGPQDPPFETDAGGIMINFGDSETGSGDEIPQSDDVAEPTPPQQNVATPVTTKDDDIYTQDDAPVEVVKKKPDVKKKPVEKPVVVMKPSAKTTITTTVNTPPSPPKPKATFPGNKSNNATSQGNTGGSGDQGDPDGNPFTNGKSKLGGNGDPNGLGGGDGYLEGFSMAGRKVIKKPTVTDNSQKTGKVKVEIVADKNGNIISARAVRLGSTTDDSYLFSLSEKAARTMKVSASETSNEQRGSIVFKYGVK